MSAQSVGGSKFTIDFSQPRKTECRRLRDCLGDVVATTMQSIAEQTEHAMNTYEKDKKSLNQAIWYPIDYAKACLKTDQAQRLAFMQEKGHLASGYLSPKHFTPIKANDQRIHWAWIMKPDAIPSEAITEARRGLSILDCGTVCTIAQYTALLEVLGTEKFNRLFSQAVGQLMVIDYADHELQPMRHFVSFTEAGKSGNGGSEGKRKIERGQIMSFNNHPKYQQGHATGMDGNFNASCLVATPGKQTFVAHGLSSKGVNERQIRTFLADRCNENTTKDEIERYPIGSELRGLAEMTIAVEILSNHHLSKTEAPITEKDVPGLDRFSFQDFNIGLIYDLIKAPVEKVTMEFVRNHPEAKASIAIQQRTLMQKQLMALKPV